MNLQARKLQFIEAVLSIEKEEVLSELESVLENDDKELDPVLKEKLVSRALKAEEDIKAGRVNTREEAEAKIRSRFGL